MGRLFDIRRLLGCALVVSADARSTKNRPSTGRFFVINTTGAQTFLVKTRSELDAIFTRRALLKLLLMETATFTINAE